jgi:hypothetical protein
MTFQEKVLARSRAKKRGKESRVFRRAFLIILLIFVGYVTWDTFHPAPVLAPTLDISVVSPDPPPQDLSVNGERWKVWAYDYDARNLTGGRMAETYCDQREIFYDAKRIPSKEMFRETMWHEIIHAGFCKRASAKDTNWSDFTHDSPEHAGVYQLGMFLPGFVHDNPEFMKWAEDWK